MTMSLKQKKIKFRPRITLIQNIISIYIFGFQYGEEGGGVRIVLVVTKKIKQ